MSARTDDDTAHRDGDTGCRHRHRLSDHSITPNLMFRRCAPVEGAHHEATVLQAPPKPGGVFHLKKETEK
jgi:hypothetical protein